LCCIWPSEQAGDTLGPVAFNRHTPFQLGEEGNGGVHVFYHDARVVHALDRHDVSLASAYLLS